MRGLDTNVLVRFFTADDPEQTPVARAAIEGAEDRGEPLFISSVVLCELVWVLEGRTYRYPKASILGVLERILETQTFQIQGRNLVREAVARFREGRADFSDYLLGRIHDDAGCDETWTFENRLSDAEDFALLG
jgi:predicted nucleic-acid-binding protein